MSEKVMLDAEQFAERAQKFVDLAMARGVTTIPTTTILDVLRREVEYQIPDIKEVLKDG